MSLKDLAKKQAAPPKVTLIDLPGGYVLRISEYKNIVNKGRYLRADVDHPNSGWQEWFALYFPPKRTYFEPLANNISKAWIQKQLKGIVTVPDLDKWLKQ